MHILPRFFILFILFIAATAQAKLSRNEMHRFLLLRDQATIDAQHSKTKYTHFLDINLSISSGLKNLISDINEATDNSLSPIEKQLRVYELLSKNINTERFAHLDIILSAPLPSLKIKNHRFLPSAFYENDLGVSMSVENKVNVLDPRAQIYIKQDRKYGIFTKYNWGNLQKMLDFAIYRMERSDLYQILNNSDLSTKGKMFDFKDLKKKHIIYATDIRYTLENTHNLFCAEVKEMQFISSSATKYKSMYGSTPLLHVQYGRRSEENARWTPFLGQHYRKKHAVADGFYIGVMLKNLERFSFFTATGTLSRNFFTFIPQIKFPWINIDYKIKTPIKNPQHNFWVSSIHSFALSIPFP